MSKRANQRRAMRIKKVLHNYAGEADALQENITDALTDLRHLCDMENLDFYAMIDCPFAQSLSNILNFKLSVERSTQPQPLQDILLEC
jgi:hypothetical protein